MALASGLATGDHQVYNLYTFHSPPYQYTDETPDGQKLSGETVETIRCVMTRAGAQASIRLVPQNRGLYALKRNLIDGYFAVDRSAELDQNAWPSHPVALEKWHWFYIGEKPAPDAARIGVVSGSNEELWLRRQGLEPVVSVSHASQLPALLELERIDLALMDERVMSRIRRAQPDDYSALEQTFLRYVPLHLYLNPQFVSAHPDFLSRFNLALPPCMGIQTELSDAERALVQQAADGLVQDLLGTVDLSEALQPAPAAATFTDILTEDALWRVLAPQHITPLARHLLDLPASQALAHWQALHAPQVTEVLLINQQGALAAMSQLTSDYWQGDEPKFQELVQEKPGQVVRRRAHWVSPIEYDVSTNRFQVVVSYALPVTHASQEVNGVLSIGLAIEEVLKSRAN
ncbi:MAG TPA: transporter substrate-binding domain-containing protein [Marinobacter sp.]|nr:transporter substrate-binding domain-containing protein [Marinobacter sp.]